MSLLPKPDIEQAVSLHLAAFGWPKEGEQVKLGPLRCNKKCRKNHAWAWTEVRTAPRREDMTVFRYYRPHSDHDGYQDRKKWPLPSWLKGQLNVN